MTGLPAVLVLLLALIVPLTGAASETGPKRSASSHPTRVAAELSATAQVLPTVPSERLMRRSGQDPDDADDASSEDSGADKKDATSKDSKPETVDIELYYETACPACEAFISGQLAPMVNDTEFAGHLNISMFPYGNAMALPVAQVSEGYKFWHTDTTGPGYEQIHICQHGSDECLGNLIQACAISTASKEDSMNMIFCMAGMTEASPEKASYECMQKHNIAPQVIYGCVHSDRGNQIMVEFAKKTAAVPDRMGTPWILMNGKNLEINSEDSLKQGVCKALDNSPSSCKNLAKKDSGSQDPDSNPDWFRVLEEESKLPKSV